MRKRVNIMINCDKLAELDILAQLEGVDRSGMIAVLVTDRFNSEAVAGHVEVDADYWRRTRAYERSES